MSAPPPGEVRILGGRWKRTPLPVPDRAGLRPTPSRVRETLFNWLGPSLEGWQVLDAFAGTGALGLEAASRGASAVTLLEQDAAQVAALARVVHKLQADTVQVQRAEALAWMARTAQRFDLILLDPPFGAGLFEQALQAANACLAPDGCIYLESDREPAALPPGLGAWKSGRAGAVRYGLWRRQAPATLPVSTPPPTP